MLLVIGYIVGCFLVALWARDRGARRGPWIVLGVCGLLPAVYLAAGPDLLPGLSLSSLSRGQISVSGPRESVPVGEQSRRGDGPEASSAGPAAVASSAEPSPSRWHAFASRAAAEFAGVRRLGESRRLAFVGAALYLAGAAAIVARPRYGVYLMVFGALAGDAVLLPWYPFVKGFSSRESLFFVHDALIVSPLEVYLALTAISWAVRLARQVPPRPYTGPLFWPGLVLSGFIAFGFVRGLVTGGDMHVGLWESRPVCYLVPALILGSNLLETPAQAGRLMWAATAAVVVKGVDAALYYLLVLGGNVQGIETISEHAAAIHLNTVFLLGLATWMYRTSRATRILLLLVIPLVALGYVAMQRRAAFVALAIAVGLMGAVLFRDRRPMFWRVVPALAAASVVYVAVGWNAPGLLAAPARAIKSVVAVEQASREAQNSNNYRVLENRNVDFTIRQHPLAGIGFGHKFSRVVPMPDISRLFEWSEYITHNSILWMWMKTGLGGFVATLLLVGLAVAVGVRALGRLHGDELSAVVLVATLYTVMHVVYGCVDMSWDARSTVYLGALMGIVNGVAIRERP